MKKNALKKLLRHHDPYDHTGTDQWFTEALTANAAHHATHCASYEDILKQFECDLSTIQTVEDIAQIPPLPTVYFKRHQMHSAPLKKMVIKATSSGTTSGKKSMIGMRYKDLYNGFKMIWKLFKYHKLWSLKRVNYFIFGYEPTKHVDLVNMKSANGFTYVAPAKKRIYAMRWDNASGGFKVDLDTMKEGLIKAAKQRHPIRTIGFPAYTYFLLKAMQEEGIALQMPKGSLVTIGGGWKEFYTEAVDKQAFYDLVKQVLGIEEKNIIEFFGAVEHPVVMPDCEYHRIHVPVYSRVIIRDPETLEPLPKKAVGIINFLSPMNQTTPLTSVMTDDLGILHEGCECGLKAPWLEIIGRVGMKDIATCAQGAETLLNKTR